MSGGAGSETITSSVPSIVAVNDGTSSTPTGAWPPRGGTVSSSSASGGPTLVTTPLGEGPLDTDAHIADGGRTGELGPRTGFLALQRAHANSVVWNDLRVSFTL